MENKTMENKTMENKTMENKTMENKTMEKKIELFINLLPDTSTMDYDALEKTLLDIKRAIRRFVVDKSEDSNDPFMNRKLLSEMIEIINNLEGRPEINESSRGTAEIMANTLLSEFQHKCNIVSDLTTEEEKIDSMACILRLGMEDEDGKHPLPFVQAKKAKKLLKMIDRGKTPERYIEYSDHTEIMRKALNNIISAVDKTISIFENMR